MSKQLGILALFVAIFTSLLSAQVQPTSAAERLAGFEQRKVLREESIVANVPFKSIGPSIHSGRVVDVDVWEADPSHFFVAYASGGLWKTTNNGQSFDPLFDHEAVMTIGDIAVDWKQNIIWVGTGEVNASRSSYAGLGMYRSTNGGKTWEHRGLEDSHHIGRVVLHPTDTNTLWVAAMGHLYSPNQERGVFKTDDGGKTWRRVLFVDENSGAVDLILDPLDANTLYAAIWHRERRAWNFTESGSGSGIYKSVDGGESWKKLSGNKSGFPEGEGIGRIGLAAGLDSGRTVLYSILDNQNRRPGEAVADKDLLSKEQLRNMSKEEFLKLKKEEVNAFLDHHGFPEEYSFDKIHEMVRKDEILPSALAEYLEDANSLLFDTPVVGPEVYQSDDGGISWKKTHDSFLDDLFYSYGYYFGQIRVAPHDSKKLYIFGVPILRSDDGGQNWESINGDNVHADHHALWLNPKRPGHLVLGNDGGINISYDDGAHWVKCNTPPVGQFYAVAVDMAKDYNVYGGLQDNGVWTGPHRYAASVDWHDTGRYPYKSLLGGDGMQVAVDSRDNETVYAGFQFGNYFRLKRGGGESVRITPAHKLGERPLRWNWQTPIHLSQHNQDVLYMGANKLYRSLNKGTDWEAISGDLTKGGQKGDVPFGTLTSIHESPMKFGLIYAGSDDGLVHVSKDGGNTWKNISAGLPTDLWVSRVQASNKVQGRVFLALNGYRNDFFESFLWVSENYGDTWRQIGAGIPQEPVNVLKEDPLNPNLLYVGTDHGLYLSLNLGERFMAFGHGLPAVPVHDLVVHPRENELLVGTHGRSLFLADVKEVQVLSDSILNTSLYAFEIPNQKYRSNWGNAWNTWSKSAPEPSIEMVIFSKSKGELKTTVMLGDLKLFSWTETVTQGLNFIRYQAEIEGSKLTAYQKLFKSTQTKGGEPTSIQKAKNGKYYLLKGNYKVLFEKDDQKIERKLLIE